MTDTSHAHRFGPSHTAGTRVSDSCPGRRQDRAGDTAERGWNPLDRVGADNEDLCVSLAARSIPGTLPGAMLPLERRGKGEVDGSVRRVPSVASRPGEDHPRLAIASSSTTPNASISGTQHPHVAMGLPHLQSTDAYRLEHVSRLRLVSKPWLPRQPSLEVPLACRGQA